jgi:hypothetical protein
MSISEAVTTVAATIEAANMSAEDLQKLYDHAEAQTQTRDVAVVLTAATRVMMRRGLIDF